MLGLLSSLQKKSVDICSGLYTLVGLLLASSSSETRESDVLYNIYMFSSKQKNASEIKIIRSLLISEVDCRPWEDY